MKVTEKSEFLSVLDKVENLINEEPGYGLCISLYHSLGKYNYDEKTVNKYLNLFEKERPWWSYVYYWFTGYPFWFPIKNRTARLKIISKVRAKILEQNV